MAEIPRLWPGHVAVAAILASPTATRAAPRRPRPLDRTLVVHSFPLASRSSSPHTPEPPPPWPSSFAHSPSSPKPEVVPLDFAVARYFLYCLLLKLGATISPASSHLPPSAVAHCRFDLSPPSLPRACFAPLQVRGEVPDRFPSFPTSIRSCSLCLMLVVVAMAVALRPRTSSLAPGRALAGHPRPRTWYSRAPTPPACCCAALMRLLLLMPMLLAAALLPDRR